MDAYVLAVTDATFENEVLKAAQSVIVEFWKPKCAPCKTFMPVFESYALRLTGKVALYTMNAEEYPGTAQRYGIRSVPTLIAFENGEEVGRATPNRTDDPSSLEGLLRSFEITLSYGPFKSKR